MGGRQPSVVFRHGHQTSTEQLNRKPIANASAVDTCLLRRTLDSRSLPTFVLRARGFVRVRFLPANSHCAQTPKKHVPTASPYNEFSPIGVLGIFYETQLTCYPSRSVTLPTGLIA
jgi:hypothetical protein